MSTIVLPAILLIAIVAQAVLPGRRLLVITSGAGLSCLASALLGSTSVRDILANVPWDVLVILVSLGLLSELIGASRVFGVLAAHACRLSRGNPRVVALLFALGMYALSGLVNNITALLLVTPMLFVVVKLLGVSRRYLRWTLGLLLVACNLGGAATPIGDFPAVLLLGRGNMTFDAYLVRAAPATLVALLVLCVLVFGVVRPERDLERSPLGSELSVRAVEHLYRHVRVDRHALGVASVALVAMLAGWSLLPASSGISPEIIAWIGVAAALAARPAVGEDLLRKRIDVEATLVLFGLFVMVGAVRGSGLFAEAARLLEGLPLGATGQLVAFLVMAGLLTGIFSAGPSMAALLEVAEALALTRPPDAVYVGLALSVCAGSSLFLTAATSGPLAQVMTERADLRSVDGEPLRFGFVEFAPVGVMAFVVIQSVAIAYALFAVELGS